MDAPRNHLTAESMAARLLDSPWTARASALLPQTQACGRRMCAGEISLSVPPALLLLQSADNSIHWRATWPGIRQPKPFGLGLFLGRGQRFSVDVSWGNKL